MIRPLFQMSGDEARGLLFGLLEADKIQLRKYPDMPSMRAMIRDGRVRYDAYDPQEHWKTYKELADEVSQKGVAYGDCEDLAVAVAAEDQVLYGVQSLPYAYNPREGLFHVVTAVPNSAVGRPSTVVSGSVGGGGSGLVPFGFENWPVAIGADAIPGYVLQDPSRAAGMGSFGYAPDVGSNMSRYGEDAPRRRRSGRGLGGAISSLREGLLGGGTTRSTLSELGSGIRKGAGLGEGWAGRLGEQIPGRLGVVKPKEDSAVKALRKGMDSDEAPSYDEDEDLGDLEDEGEDEEFGGLDDAVASEMFGDGGHQHFDEEYGEDEEEMSGLDDAVVAEMFGGDEDDDFGLDDLYVDDLDNRTVSIEEAYGEYDPSRWHGRRGGPVVAAEESFAGASTLHRSDLFGGFRFAFDEDDEDDLLIED